MVCASEERARKIVPARSLVVSLCNMLHMTANRHAVAHHGHQSRTASLGVPILPFKLLIAIGALFRCLVLAVIVVKSIRKATAGIPKHKLFVRGVLPGLVVCLLVLAAVMYLQANTISTNVRRALLRY